MAAADIRSAQAAGKHQVPVHLVSARTGDGVSHLIKLIDDCTPSEVSRIRWRERLASVWMRRFNQNPKLEQVLAALEAGELDLTQAMNELERAVE